MCVESEERLVLILHHLARDLGQRQLPPVPQFPHPRGTERHGHLYCSL